MLELPQFAASNFPPSPTFILSQMSDPSTVLNSLCSPFLKEEISPDCFSLSFVENVLIPNIQKTIISDDMNKENTDTLPNSINPSALTNSPFPGQNFTLDKFANLPKLIKIIVDNLDIEGLNLIESQILEFIVEIYLMATTPQIANNIIDLYCELLSSIPSKYRDDVLVDTINKYSTASDHRLRILAVNIISLVRKNERVVSQFITFSKDKIPTVRAAVINCLQNCNFDSPVIELILTNAAKDHSSRVRNAAASVFGFLTPHLTDEYLQLLKNPSTTESALDSFQAMANFSGFSPFFDTFILIISAFPNKCAKVLIEYSPFVDASEHRLLYKCAKKLRSNFYFIENLYTFSRVFSNKERFLKFFNIEKMTNWRERALYAKICIDFVDDFKIDIIPIVFNFAYDTIEIVRNLSVDIMVKLVKIEPNSVYSIVHLVEGGWHQRLVLAKVLAQVGISEQLLETAQKLSHDSVSNVRYCLAVGVKGTNYFDQLFNDCKDSDILCAAL
ncbi:hypothetical protein TRFO_09743 [Tritrichomonas foetus]|uniref:Uncharacterized protein n=1 Tax=Tritrichomonas foetus TaxID=1144522 RepID=A0A1J4JCL5_9EUKA|nr:hypothetical protein TRFO_09743 [Tritrichomonas foetus]|eukprot:OHS96848.1 hypothetical protein TRFO_09743 [Tritrichomonas foetus]